MKYKIALCKIHMIGSPALVLGFCHYDDEDEWWDKYQLFTMEDYLECQYKWQPPDPNNSWSSSIYKNQEECDKASKQMREAAQKFSKYHGDVVHFDSINKDVKVHKSQHDFTFSDAYPVEINRSDWELLRKELNKDQWQAFDLETWGK